MFAGLAGNTSGLGLLGDSKKKDVLLKGLGRLGVFLLHLFVCVCV